MFLASIGPWQILLIAIVPISIFLLGYTMGKKAGYIKRVHEVEKKEKQL